MVAINPALRISAPSLPLDREIPPADPSAVAAYEQERDHLFAVAYRMLGSALDAEDVLQEAYLRWHRVDHRTIERPAAFLTRMVRRLALNVLGSADRRRIEYEGVHPSEGAGEAAEDPDPLRERERTEEVSVGIALLLERLTPAGRAVFLLRECFGYSYAEIAVLLGTTEQNCRQIESRARLRLRQPRRTEPVADARHRELLERFVRAARDGEMEALVDLLVTDAREHVARGMIRVLRVDGSAAAGTSATASIDVNHSAAYPLAGRRHLPGRCHKRPPPPVL